ILRDANAAADVVSRIRALFQHTIKSQTRSAVGPVITDVKRSLNDLAVRHRVLVHTCIDHDLPQVAIDNVHIQQILTNLMRNALEAMETNAGPGRLSVRARRNGALVQLDVFDDGPGIEHPEKIFDAFFTTKESGMGMGLAISRSIVESHGGRLWVERNESG